MALKNTDPTRLPVGSLLVKPPVSNAVIGFVGLGVMGASMVTHLANAGYRVCLLDARKSVAKKLASKLDREGRSGSRAQPRVWAAHSLREVASSCDVIFTMLPHGGAVQQVVMGAHEGGKRKGDSEPDSLLPGLRKGTLLVDTSSSEPWLTRQTAEALRRVGVSMLDAPVSGAAWGAAAANLVFMVGGAAKDLKRARPLLDLMGKSVFHLGPLSSGHAMKCINNLITAVTFAATAEGLSIGQAHGLDATAMVDVLNVSTGQSWITQNHIPQRILNRRFDDPFQLALMLKDVGIANQLARDAQASVALSALTQQLYQAANRQAGPGASVSELVRWVERQSGLEIAGARTR